MLLSPYIIYQSALHLLILCVHLLPAVKDGGFRGVRAAGHASCSLWGFILGFSNKALLDALIFDSVNSHYHLCLEFN